MDNEEVVEVVEEEEKVIDNAEIMAVLTDIQGTLANFQEQFDKLNPVVSDEPVDEPVDEPTDEPVDEPTDEPVDEPTEEYSDEKLKEIDDMLQGN